MTIASGLPEDLWAHSCEVSNIFSLHLRDQSPPQCFQWTRRSASATGGRTCLWLVTYPSSRGRVSFVFQFDKIPSHRQQSELVDLVLQILCTSKTWYVFQRTSRSRHELLGRKLVGLKQVGRKKFGLITCGVACSQGSATLYFVVTEDL